jgi:hypothetical protein
MTERSVFAGLAVLLAAGSLLVAPPLQAEDRPPAAKPTEGKRVEPAAAVAPAPLATNSRLPYPADADRWVDAVSTQAVIVSVPGVGDVTVRKQSVLVYRPAGDRMRWEDLIAQHVAAGTLPAGAEPRMQMLKLPEGEREGTNTYEDRVYATRVPGEHLTLGMVRNLRTQHLLVYAVLLQSKMEDTPALLFSRDTAGRLAEQARQRRIATPVPAGAVAAAPVIRLQGAQLRQLQESLTSDANVSPTVKRIAQVVFPQATSVTRSVWRTAAPMSDRAFVDYYLGEARRLGWGAPVSRDETHVGKPTLLFQRPYSGGVVLLRAQPTPVTTATPIPRASTTIFTFEMEGNINVSALLTR